MALDCKEPYFPVGGTYVGPGGCSFGGGGVAKASYTTRDGGFGDRARIADDAVARVTLEVVLCEEEDEPVMRTSALRDWTGAPTTVRWKFSNEPPIAE